MGGLGSGGFRQGAGSKPRDEHNVVGELPAVVPVPVDLSDAERVVWERLAPRARERRTLTVDTADRFRLLCKSVVMEEAMSARLLTDGWTYIASTVDGSGQERETLKAHPLCGPHRGMLQRVEAGMVAFRLAPIGKALNDGPTAAPKTALDTLRAQRPATISRIK